MCDATAHLRRSSIQTHIPRWFLAAVIVATCTNPVLAPCDYEVTVLLQYPITCGFGTVITSGIGLNEHGAIVGSYQCPVWTHSEAFVWTPEEGYKTLVRPPGVSSSQANDINDEGVVVGTYVRTGVGFRGFVYQNEQYTELPPLQGPYSWAYAINNAGIVAGARTVREKAAPFNAYLWHRENGFTDLGVMTGPYSSASGINEAGAVVGWTGNGGTVSDSFRWEKGSVTLLGPIPGGFTSQALAISENGVIVGSGRIPMKGAPVGATRAYLWKDQNFTLLGTLPEHTRSAALGVSPDGFQAVGSSWNVNGNPNIDGAFLWQNAVMTNLEDLDDSALTFSNASRVNGWGQILAGGVLLTPVGQPPGDLDRDCEVGIIDFLLLLSQWGVGGSTADLDGSGTVDGVDMAILLDNWG